MAESAARPAEMKSMPPGEHSEYPRVADYAEALQHPGRCFSDPELKASVAEPDARGDPRPRTGGQAAVFKLERPGKAVAVKVFKRYQASREQRYRLISDYLRGITIRYLVHFEYLEQGIRVAGDWFPILRMDWVAGLTLTAWVQQRMQHKDVQ